MNKSTENELIARCYNEDMTTMQIKEQLFDKLGVDIRYNTLFKRIERLKERGRLDYTKQNNNEPDILDEIEAECDNGFFEIGVLDIETTGLWADFGYVLCAVVKNLNTGEHQIFRLDETKSYKDKKLKGDPAYWRRIDKELLEQIRDAYDKYDIIIHFNGRNFDIKFLNTRLIKNNIKILPDMKQLDIYQIAKHRLRLRSKRLDALKEFLEIDEEEEGHKWEYWQMAANGVKEGFDYIVAHCIKDVDRLFEVAKRMKSQINFIKK